MIVVPKTSASSDNPWFGLAKYAWSGYVNTHTDTHTYTHLLSSIQLSHAISPTPSQVCVGVWQLWRNLPQQTVLDGKPGS